MVKNSAYIRKFTPAQKALLEELSTELGLKNANDILLHVLEHRKQDHQEIARLKRFLVIKQKKIERLENQNNDP